MYNAIAQFIGFFGFGTSVISFQSKEEQKLYAIQVFMKLFFAVHFLKLGGFAGAALNFIGLVNCAVYYLKSRSVRFLERFSPLYWFAAAYLFAGVLTAVLKRDWLELLPAVAAVSTAFMFDSANVRTIKYYQLFIVSPCWMIYNITLLSYSGIITETFNIVSVLIALYRFRGEGKALVLHAAAKINLVLSVRSRRDDGYHELSSVMQTVGIFDRLTVKKAKKISVRSKHSPKNADNICYKAAECFSQFGGADIYIEKNIPMAAGLGGGSADAAATLLALNKLYGTPFTDEQLSEKALSLGADVPFFLGSATARADGVGEKLIPVCDRSLDLVVVKHGQKESTGTMYKWLDESGLTDRKSEVDRFVALLENGSREEISSSLFNDFERVSLCSDIKDNLVANGALGAGLSGSGPSVFGIFADEEAAVSCFEAVKDKYDYVFVCKSACDAVVFE